MFQCIWRHVCLFSHVHISWLSLQRTETASCYKSEVGRQNFPSVRQIECQKVCQIGSHMPWRGSLEVKYISCLFAPFAAIWTMTASQEPPFPPLRSRVAPVDFATFDFLITLEAFSQREVQGDSFLDPSHLEPCLEVRPEDAGGEEGEPVWIPKKESRCEFQELLAASFDQRHPCYVYLKARSRHPRQQPWWHTFQILSPAWSMWKSSWVSREKAQRQDEHWSLWRWFWDLLPFLIVTAPAWFHPIAFQINKCLARSVQICTALCQSSGVQLAENRQFHLAHSSRQFYFTPCT